MRIFRVLDKSQISHIQYNENCALARFNMQKCAHVWVSNLLCTGGLHALQQYPSSCMYLQDCILKVYKFNAKLKGLSPYI